VKCVDYKIPRKVNKTLAEKNLINTEIIANNNCFYSYSKNMHLM